MAISDYDATPANNTSISGLAVSDSTVANTLDNIIRQMMADTFAHVGGTIDNCVIGSTTAAAGTFTTLVTDNSLSGVNVVRNGAMEVAQEGTSFTGVTATQHICDLFKFTASSLGTWTLTQEADAPAGFNYSLKAAVTTADASPAAADYAVLTYSIQGKDLRRFKKGDSGAIGFATQTWIKCSNTGTFQVNLRDTDNTRIVSGTVTIAVADTWEYATILFPGDTSGAFTHDANESLQIEIFLDSGTDYSSGASNSTWAAETANDRNADGTIALGDTIGNYIQITGVQVEPGGVVGPFEHKLFDAYEREVIPRYWAIESDASVKIPICTGMSSSTTTVRATVTFPAQMAGVPTAGATSGDVFGSIIGGSTRDNMSLTSTEIIGKTAANLIFTTSGSAFTAPEVAILYLLAGSGNTLEFDARM